MAEKQNQVEDIFNELDASDGRPAERAQNSIRNNKDLPVKQQDIGERKSFSNNTSSTGKTIWKKRMPMPVFVAFIIVVIGIGVFVLAGSFLSGKSGSVLGILSFGKPVVNRNLADKATQSDTFNNRGFSQKVVVAGDNNDSDSDGLDDGEEKKLGTNPMFPDSDSDGLYDREEVKVYHSDPLNPDTDGDGIMDGQEVKRGLNPVNGSKLLDLQAELTKKK